MTGGRAEADALSVEQKNDLAATRQKLSDRLLFGNLDPYNLLVTGTPQAIQTSVQASIAIGVDAIWPGCDIWPAIPPANFEAMTAAVRVEALGTLDEISSLLGVRRTFATSHDFCEELLALEYDLCHIMSELDDPSGQVFLTRLETGQGNEL